MPSQLPKKALRGASPRLSLPRTQSHTQSRTITALVSALPIRSRRKATPAERLLALVTRPLVTRRQPKSPATRWWADRSQAQRITTVALAASATATLVSASAWAGARLLAQRKSAREALAAPTAAELETPETADAELDHVAETVPAL